MVMRDVLSELYKVRENKEREICECQNRLNLLRGSLDDINTAINRYESKKIKKRKRN